MGRWLLWLLSDVATDPSGGRAATGKPSARQPLVAPAATARPHTLLLGPDVMNVTASLHLSGHWALDSQDLKF